MSRLEFRGWDKRQREYVPVVFVDNNGGIYSPQELGLDEIEFSALDIIIERYTGYKDDSPTPVKIFEGDIVKLEWFDGLAHNVTIAEIKYANELCGFVADDRKRSDFYGRVFAGKKVTKLGNIHQNPELLEVKK